MTYEQAREILKTKSQHPYPLVIMAEKVVNEITKERKMSLRHKKR